MTLVFELFRREPYFIKAKQGEYLFREGDPSKETMYALITGQADIVVGGHVVEQIGAGAIVGEMGIILPHELRSASVQATTDCEFAEITSKRFDFLVSQAPYFAREMMSVLAERLRNTDKLLKK